MRITDKVYFYQGLQGGARSWSNSVVIKGKKNILIDSGPDLKNHLNDLFGAMAEDGIKISEIDEFWYTHGHPDHAGSAGVLSKEFKRKVRCHFLAQDVLESHPVMRKFIIYLIKEAIRGKKIIKTPFFRGFWRKFGLKLLITAPFSWITLKIAAIIMARRWGKWLPVLALEVFDEEELIEINPDIQILFLPGHTPEEIGFWVANQKTLIIGDLISVTSLWREKIPILNNPNSNFRETLSSLKKIVNLPIEILIPGHGFFLRGERLIKDHLTKMIISMERHRERVKELIEKNPKINIDELLEIVFRDLPSIAPDREKKNYLVAILDDLGYYKKSPP